MGVTKHFLIPVRRRQKHVQAGNPECGGICIFNLIQIWINKKI